MSGGFTGRNFEIGKCKMIGNVPDQKVMQATYDKQAITALADGSLMQYDQRSGASKPAEKYYPMSDNYESDVELQNRETNGETEYLKGFILASTAKAIVNRNVVQLDDYRPENAVQHTEAAS